jgi:hypothetical protein
LHSPGVELRLGTPTINSTRSRRIRFVRPVASETTRQERALTPLIPGHCSETCAATSAIRSVYAQSGLLENRHPQTAAVRTVVAVLARLCFRVRVRRVQTRNVHAEWPCRTDSERSGAVDEFAVGLSILIHRRCQSVGVDSCPRPNQVQPCRPSWPACLDRESKSPTRSELRSA